MEMVQEDRGPEPGLPPSEIIDVFEESHRLFIDGVLAAHAQPSAETLLEADRLSRIAKRDALPFFVEDYFKASDEEMVIESAIGAVMMAVEELAAHATALNELGSPTVAMFGEDFKEKAVSDISGDDKDKSNLRVAQLSNTYHANVESLIAELEKTTPVTTFRKREERLIKIKAEALGFGKMMLAAYIGTRLAQKRR